ncbi:MAG: 23S rRNA (uracil(1939)-C(5))-methyltransferase RlmD [Bacteroidia bacterium]|nr:23S rRNA (uracil(1939)-C(5))-methyltransferase RlmD [Bacteroidia bacterium]MDW8134488.1 23S rRNA (uracil(1939)-C(5))-methyltransferase RlmD [Bacteroidia bacterium]
MSERQNHQKVIDLASEGFGVIRPANRPAILVPYTIEEEVVDIEIVRHKRQVSYGYATRWHVSSPHRVVPACEEFGKCGGCQWQMMDYAHQLHHKRRFVEQALRHIGGMSVSVPPVIPSPNIWHYRNKAEYTFGRDSTGGLCLGFHPRGDFSTALNLKECKIVPPLFEAIRRKVLELAQEKKLSAYDPRTHRGLLRQLLVRGVDSMAIALISLAEDRADIASELLLPLRQAFPALRGVGYFYNPKLNDSLHDLTPHLIEGELLLEFSVANRIYFVTPKDFFQVNLAQTENMINWIRERFPTSVEVLYDLYGGVGLFSIALADRAKEVVLVERLAEAVQSACKNFEANKSSFPHTRWRVFCGSLEELWSQAISSQENSIAIVDPSREGLHPTIRKALQKAPFASLFYVSCHPATQARDLQYLKEHYVIEEVQPFDLFPHTSSIENIVLLKRKV